MVVTAQRFGVGRPRRGRIRAGQGILRVALTNISQRRTPDAGRGGFAGGLETVYGKGSTLALCVEPAAERENPPLIGV